MAVLIRSAVGFSAGNVTGNHTDDEIPRPVASSEAGISPGAIQRVESGKSTALEGKTMDDEKRIDAMIALLRSMKTDRKRQAKLSSVNCMDMSPKQAQKRNADADWIAMAQIKRGHELHALAVELGFAERRQSYEAIELRDDWHRFKYTPPTPA